MKRLSLLTETALPLLLGMAFMLFLGPIACQHKLDPAGVYKGDSILWDADGVIANGHDVLQGFVTWEEDNRATLAKVSPEIKKLADRIVEQGPSWFSSALALRDAYAADPSKPNKDALTTGIAVLKAAISEAQHYTTANKAPPIKAAASTAAKSLK